MSLQIRRLSYALGAEIKGVDIREPLDDRSFGEVHAAFLKYGIILFRGQCLTRAQHVAFSRRFGRLDTGEEYLVGKDQEYPEITVIKPELHSKPTDYFVGEYWHSDRSFKSTPAGPSLLRAVEVPEVGGDTIFANMYVAYETLSDGMKKLIEGLHAVHIVGRRGRQIDNSTPERALESKRRNPPIAQPLVRVHPETGRKSLYLSEVSERIEQLVGLSAEESKPLLRFLGSHATRPQFVYRHRWQKDDLIIWDNRCMMHRALGDYDRTQSRHMERTTLIGTPSGVVYTGPLVVGA